jgi:hypothetical protein
MRGDTAVQDKATLPLKVQENVSSSHAARDTFLFSILHHGDFPAPISMVLGCSARTEVNWLRGGYNVWIQLLKERENEWDILERAHVLVKDWVRMDVDEGWAQMVRVLSDGRIGGASKKRKLED